MNKKLIQFLILCFTLMIFTPISTFAEETKRSEVHFLDTGQSDCILIKGLNKNFLIDTGEIQSNTKIKEYLTQNKVKEIDTIVITHYHNDHYGGLKEVLSNFKVKSVLLPAHYNIMKNILYMEARQFGAEVRFMDKALKLTDVGINLLVIPPSSTEYLLENNNCSIVEGSIDNIKYLFMADAEAPLEKSLIHHGQIKKCDVIKIPHHGIITSTTRALLHAAKPKIAVITCNESTDESPSMNVLLRLTQNGITILRTDKLGDVIVKAASKPSYIEIITRKQEEK